jgi:S-adenosylmethionine:tRNA ribosyltransferase-isomerase
MDLNFQDLSLADFSYSFPSELVAQHPLNPRDQSKLLLRSSEGNYIHSKVEEFSKHLNSKTLLVMNDTRVFASRLSGKLDSGYPIEVFLLRHPGSQCDLKNVPCFLKPGKKVKEGMKIYLDDQSFATILHKPLEGEMQPFLLDFSNTPKDFPTWLLDHGFVPLPPYIKREKTQVWKESKDSLTYQTVYAKHEGSVAAPTAGLHFTETLIEALLKKGIELCPITLHVSSGTFLPVKTEDISQHKMHEEYYFIPATSWEKIQKAKSTGQPILAVGTTSFRSIESFMKLSDKSSSLNTWMKTDLFIYPKNRSDRYRSEIFNGIMTNFHQPCSTLFMLVSALIGLDEAQNLYKEATDKEYRLFSYGDSSLLWFDR